MQCGYILRKTFKMFIGNIYYRPLIVNNFHLKLVSLTFSRGLDFHSLSCQAYTDCVMTKTSAKTEIFGSTTRVKIKLFGLIFFN